MAKRFLSKADIKKGKRLCSISEWCSTDDVIVDKSTHHIIAQTRGSSDTAKFIAYHNPKFLKLLYSELEYLQKELRKLKSVAGFET